jgi:hypothetical protein
VKKAPDPGSGSQYCLFEIIQINILGFKMSQELDDPEVKIVLQFQKQEILRASK